MRTKILEAARELFASEGYERVTMRRIAEAIEYSPTTIYLHFEDKDALVNALCTEDFARLLATFQAQGIPEDPVDWIRQLGRAYAAFGLDHPNHYRFMFMTGPKFEAVHELSSPGQGSFHVLLQAVQKAMAEGRIRRDDAPATAQVLWAAIHGAVALLITLRPQHWPHGPAAPDLIDRVIETTLRGLQTPAH